MTIYGKGVTDHFAMCFSYDFQTVYKTSSFEHRYNSVEQVEPFKYLGSVRVNYNICNYVQTARRTVTQGAAPGQG